MERAFPQATDIHNDMIMPMTAFAGSFPANTAKACCLTPDASCSNQGNRTRPVDPVGVLGLEVAR